MVELASILAAYMSFALLHGAEPDRLPAHLRRKLNAIETWRIGARVAAALFAGLSLWLWSLAGDGALVLVGPLAAWALSGCAVVLLRPVYPRIIWGLTAFCSPTIIALCVLGSGHVL